MKRITSSSLEMGMGYTTMSWKPGEYMVFPVDQEAWRVHSITSGRQSMMSAVSSLSCLR